MTIDVTTSIARILKLEGVEWVSTFPVCRVNNALGREGLPLLMRRSLLAREAGVVDDLIGLEVVHDAVPAACRSS